MSQWTDEKRLKISLLSRLLDLSAEYEDILKQAQKLQDKDVVTCAMGMTLKDVVELNAKEAYELAVKNFKQADQNHDGKLSPTEFEHWYTSSEVVRLCDVLKRCFRKSNAKVKKKLEQEMHGIDRWEPPMKIERSRANECPLVNAVVKNRYSIDYHRGTGGYKAVYVVFSRFFVGFDHVTEITQSLTHTHRYKAYDMKTKRPVCLALFRQPDKDSDPKTRYIEMGKELEASRSLIESGLEHQGLLNILDMSEPETPVPIVLQDPDATDVAEGKNANILSRVHFITLDLADIELGNLRDSQQNLAFSEKLARFVFKQLMDVLEYLHKKNIFHRDIKGDNIMLCKTKYVVFESRFFSTYTPQSYHKLTRDRTQVRPREMVGCDVSRYGTTYAPTCTRTILYYILV